MKAEFRVTELELQEILANYFLQRGLSLNSKDVHLYNNPIGDRSFIEATVQVSIK
jgi:hypothetical protein